MTLQLNDQQYQVLLDLIDSISKKDNITLSTKFNLTQEIQDEIAECLDNYYDPATRLTAPPLDRAAEPAGGGRSLIEVFYMNDGSFGIECILYANGNPGEAILHAEMTPDPENPKISYKYIGS